MNILLSVINMTAENGGVTTHIIDLCKELLGRGNKVILLYDKNDCDYQTSIEKLKTFSDFKFIHCSMEGIQYDLKKLLAAVERISRLAEEEKIDIIHTHSQSLCVAGALVKLKTGIPYIWTNHIDEMANPALFRKILKFFHFPIISVSTDLKQLLVNDFGVNETRITVVNNGIDPEKFPPLSDGEKIKLKEKFGCENKYIIGLLARMSYGKGHMYLLEAVNRLQQEENIKNIKILIAGKLHDSEKGYLKKLRDYAENHNIDMVFWGFQDPREVFGVSDIAVLPSLYEGFPLTVLEALIMACPVIRSDTPGWRDTEDFTLVFKKKDVKALADHLSYAYHNPELMEQMGKRGRQTVLDRFTIGHQVDATTRVYMKCVKKICYIVTKPSTIEAFFIPQLQYLSGHGYDVTVVCDYSDYLQDKLGNGIRYVPVNIPRGISIGGSVLAIRSLTEFFKKEKFNMIQYSTPNAALYASIAAKKAGIKIRNYHIMGFRYLGSSGIGRMVLKKVEKITCRNSTSIECVSRSNLESGVREKIFDKKKAAVVWNGSSGGIDLKKFNCEYREQYRDKIRKKYGINKNDFVFGFVGRITKDKGVNEILKAFSGINDAKLMMVGDPEATDTLDQKLYTDTLKNNNVIYTGNVTEIEQYYSAIDVLLLPSYREGFGNAVIEAGAMGTPSIISNIPGPKDAVIPNETALVIEPQDPDALLEAMKKMMGGKVTEMGNAAADHVRKSFDSEKLNEFILERKNELFEGVRDAKSIHHYGRL